MKKIVKKFSLLAMAVALCVGMSTVSAEAATAAKVSKASIKTTTGGDFVKGVSKAKVSFQISGKKSDVTVSILNSSGKSVYKKTLSGCSTGKTYTVEWAGKTNAGKWVKEDSYRAQVTAGKSSKKTVALKFIVKSGFAGGDGSKKYPYKVANQAQLKNVVKHNGKNFVQTANINFNQEANIPLFTNDAPFVGVYDGKNYTISNINNPSEADYIGIFRAIGSKGTVKNLKVKDCSFTGNGNVAVIAGANYGTISNCSVTDCIVTAKYYNVAAVAGHNKNGKVMNCKASKNTINGTQSSVGTMVGYNESGSVNNCTSTEDIINSGNYAGGIVGESTGTISDCVVNEDFVSGTRVGGVLGKNAGGTVKNCEVSDLKHQIQGRFLSGGIVAYSCGVEVNNTYYGDLDQVAQR